MPALLALHSLLETRSSSGDEIANVNFFMTTSYTPTTKYNRLAHKFRHRGHAVFSVNRKPSITTGKHHNGKPKLK